MHPLILEAKKRIPTSLTPVEARVFGVEGQNDRYRGVMFLVHINTGRFAGQFDGFCVTKSCAGLERCVGATRDEVRNTLNSARQWQSEWETMNEHEAMIDRVKLIRQNQAMKEALERLVSVSNLVSARLHMLGQEMGHAGSYDGNYPCSAHHVELDFALDQAQKALKEETAPATTPQPNEHGY